MDQQAIAPTIDVTLGVPMRRVLDLVIGAFDSGVCNYWLTHEHTELPEDFNVYDIPWLSPREKADWVSVRKDYFAPFVTGGRVEFYEYEDDEGGKRRQCVLDSAAIVRGLRLMPTKAPRQFADFITGDDDAETADVFMQLCLLGEVIYG